MPKKPKRKCCTSRPRCGRCPLRMLAEDRLPPGYAVRKRRLVKLGGGGSPPDPGPSRSGAKKSDKKVTKKAARKAAKRARALDSLPDAA